MKRYRLKSGEVLTEADLELLADEAERGYDLSKATVVPNPLLRSTLPAMRRFLLIRHKDPLGISGTGPVAGGIEFENGVVYMQWFSTVIHSEVRYASMGDVRAITCAPQQHSEIHYVD